MPRLDHTPIRDRALEDRLYAHFLRVMPENHLTRGELGARERAIRWDSEHPSLYREHRGMVGRTVRLTEDRVVFGGTGSIVLMDVPPPKLPEDKS